MTCKGLFLGFLTLFIGDGNLLIAMEAAPQKLLLQAATEGNLDGVKEAVRLGADVNATGADLNQAVHLAARGGHIPVLDFLLSRGVNINATGEFGALPIHLAAEKGAVETVAWLVEHGADSNAIGGLFDKSPLFTATGKVPEWLIEHGVVIDLGDSTIQAKLDAAYADPLLRAIILKKPEEALNLLTDYLNKPEKDATWIRRVFLVAAARGESSVIEFMLNHFLDFIDEESLQKAFLVAILGNSLATVQMIFRLLQRREEELDGGWFDTFNRALFYAVYRRNIPVLEYLINRDFTLTLHLDLNAVGNYVTRLLRSKYVPEKERDEYMRMRDILTHAFRTRRVGHEMEESLSYKERETELAALFRTLPVELMLYILSFVYIQHHPK